MLPERTGRIADNLAARSDIAGYDTAGSDDGAISYDDACQHNCPATDSDIAPDGHDARNLEPGGVLGKILVMLGAADLIRWPLDGMHADGHTE